MQIIRCVPCCHRCACTARSQSNRIESNRIESNRIESNRIESNRIESNRIESPDGTRLLSSSSSGSRRFEVHLFIVSIGLTNEIKTAGALAELLVCRNRAPETREP
eukprot:jgi/Psemu1/204415/e_gw1.348.9.1